MGARKDKMSSPNNYKIRNVELEITNFCSHKCPYCYIGDINYKENVYFSDYSILCKIIDKLSEYGAEMIALLGGDPVLHPRILDIINYIKCSTDIKVSIMSNTLNFGKTSIYEIAKKIDNIDFTLHGRNAKEHEAYCNAPSGTYNDVMSKLEKYSHNGVTVNIAINITPETFNKIYDMVATTIAHGVNLSALLLQRIIPLGRAKYKNNYDVSKGHIAIALEQIENVEKDFNIEISFEDPYPLCVVPEKYHKYMKGCPEGINRIPVKGDGSITACGAVGDVKIGNILTDTYDEIWTNNKRFMEFRCGSFLTNEKCLECTMKDKCRGGCPVRYIMSEQEHEPFWKKFEPKSN